MITQRNTFITTSTIQPRDGTATSAKVRAAALGIEHLERFTDALLEEIIVNRTTPNDGTRPLTVVVYAKGDHNGAFGSNLFLEELAKESRLLYYEAGSDTELVRALRDSTAQGDISRLHIGGHGSAASLILGHDARNPDHCVDLSDEAKLAGVFERVMPYGLVLLDSCSTARGGEHANTVAAMIARLAPHATVVAAEDVAYRTPRFAKKQLSNTEGFTSSMLVWPAFGAAPGATAKSLPSLGAGVVLATQQRVSPMLASLYGAECASNPPVPRR